MSALASLWARRHTKPRKRRGIFSNTLLNASGDALDAYGAELSHLRQGRSDVVYKSLLVHACQQFLISETLTTTDHVPSQRRSTLNLIGHMLAVYRSGDTDHKFAKRMLQHVELWRRKNA